MHENAYTIGLIGNPNVGKSTVFNQLTGLKQHTGNWTGKTVANAVGTYTHNKKVYQLIDTPGTYSLHTNSQEEEITRDFILSGQADVIVMVADATCLARNLILVLQVLAITKKVVLCINLIDEAKKKKIQIDAKKLSTMLDIPVVLTGARGGVGLNSLKERIENSLSNANTTVSDTTNTLKDTDLIAKSEEIFEVCVLTPENTSSTDRKIDHILTHPFWGTLSMLTLLFLVFYLTIVGANYPSQYLQKLLFSLEPKLYTWLNFLPKQGTDLLVGGMYRTLAWVTSVMLPPMAIFFPLFTILEDLGFLPRVAFNLDNAFRIAGAHGKQSLTMCMGFGCNACGVTGCRIIDSPRERLIAILTNNLVPCNGRFPTLIAIISMFFTAKLPTLTASVFSGLILMLLILLSIAMTFAVSYFLSHTLLRGTTTSFALELPPYRTPQIGSLIVRSLLDRTVFVLGRAVCIAAPAGLLIWLMANVHIADISLLSHISGFIDPFARLFGMDGMILMAFILGLPANEIVLPILLMGYLATGTLTDFSSLSALHTLLVEHGWTLTTAVCVCIFSLFHFPCATTLVTIFKETHEIKWTLVAFFLPTTLGFALCFIINALF